ncbi:MAG TPA: FkbM family methyltransferase, partial [Steroidobacteraceae bacterium]|nr:FkbM family methyltransferase [Steroidobacteraceae bacterium]
SMDGADAMVFRDSVPESCVYAFEPNPRNLRLMQEDPLLQVRNIQIVPFAVTNYDGEAEFFLVDADYSRSDYRRGMGSLYRRSDGWAPAAVVPVKATRLDTFLADKCAPHSRLALWIDSEGKAHEVIEGMTGIADRVHLLHIEVETTPCIGTSQKLYADVKAQLWRLGFTEIGTDQARLERQFNALFVRSDVSPDMRFRLKAWQVGAWLRYRLARVIRRVCPACLRRYQARRSAKSLSHGPQSLHGD